MHGIRIAAAHLFVAFSAASAGAGESDPVGTWLHGNKRIKVAIAPCGDALCGSIVWFRWPNDAEGAPLVDLMNPNPALRDRPLLGLRVLDGLRPEGPGKWTGGRIYNPDDGVQYRAELTIGEDGDARIRAYVLLPLFGKTFIWTRGP